MRIVLAVIALTAATPALAQRVDTRRMDIHPGPAAHFDNCGFTAVEALRLQEFGEDSSKAVASWFVPADNVAPGAATLHMAFAPVPGDASSTTVAILHAEIRLAGTPASARLRIEGQDSKLVLAVAATDAPGRYLVEPRESDRDAMIDWLVAATSAESEPLDRSGASLGRFVFDVHELRRIPELLELVRWRCTSPDRG